MHDNLKQAADLLLSGNYTCVLCGRDCSYTDIRRGVRPLLELLDRGKNLCGFVAADKVVGKAAAFLYVLMGVSAVYAQVISDPAKEVLSRYRIELVYAHQVPAIENRTKTGLCPIERSVWDIDDPQIALGAIRRTLETL